MNDHERHMRILYHLYPGWCDRKYTSRDRCPKYTEHGWCREATGPLELTLAWRRVIPDIHDYASVLAYGQPCFLHSSYTRANKGTYSVAEVSGERRTKRFIFALLFSVIMGGIVESSIKSALDAQMEKFNGILSQRLGSLAARMNTGLMKVEHQIDNLHKGQLKLQHEVTVLARFTEALSDKEAEFEDLQLSLDRQLLQNQVANSRAILENHELALAAGKRSAQQAVIEYHIHKRVIALMEHLEPIAELKQDRVYKTTIRKGIIANEKLYWYGKNLSQYMQHFEDTEAIEQVRQEVTQLPRELKRIRAVQTRWTEEASGEAELRQAVERIENATLPPMQLINFTIHWEPITMEFVDVNWTGGAEKVLGAVLNLGGKVVDDVAGVVNNVVDKGADIVEHTKDTISGFFSKPIQLTIIIVGSVVGLIMVLVIGSCACRYVKTGQAPNPDKALRLATTISGLKPLALAGKIVQEQQA